mmetsp:Transcript_69175/g.184356  ORF Transcript_69175/g.184356 Transcript_69175/m.184356 type:complete len:178 (+) Transcript_69175:182-715(+)|eukprot:CAMPEP_0113694786 /NCGR_PEP_ID=MMETSP0038_2-20120614/20504_1 /TAXON_ID=2898 /ORGANISM="Cryptomonas paramecium" /LENGTH=177 /DNA_ID=CAMNT_0000617189 /DNA_START=80 /DNA_END=613 /DNA_ORIENTATION=- /assembly_acc=CAM_ASM_000170
MGNYLTKSSEYKEMKKQTKKNTVINSNIPQLDADFRSDSPSDKSVSFLPSVQVMHFDVEAGEVSEIVSESVNEEFDDEQEDQMQPMTTHDGQHSPTAMADPRRRFGGLTIGENGDSFASDSSQDSPVTPVPKQSVRLAKQDSIVVAKSKRDSLTMHQVNAANGTPSSPAGAKAGNSR